MFGTVGIFPTPSMPWQVRQTLALLRPAAGSAARAVAMAAAETAMAQTAAGKTTPIDRAPMTPPF
jgi:hypothetical protein